jgi:hypothetical protein
VDTHIHLSTTMFPVRTCKVAIRESKAEKSPSRPLLLRSRAAFFSITLRQATPRHDETKDVTTLSHSYVQHDGHGSNKMFLYPRLHTVLALASVDLTMLWPRETLRARRMPSCLMEGTWDSLIDRGCAWAQELTISFYGDGILTTDR